MPDTRHLVTTNCHECVIDITGWDFGPGDKYTAVNIVLLSPGDAMWRQSFKGRLHRVWLDLLNHDPDPWLELLDKETMDKFIAALQDAREQVWGVR